ncbi:unnamed protein product [Paramecium sonneborni]|uniref:Uncharacterized protein n=1 Tax=Paramecium sonneborni TaxID=65129 RepID=A0A8S1QU23_9CILI|nr:unnamed protein product [Paramecium sonneborni]
MTPVIGLGQGSKLQQVEPHYPITFEGIRERDVMVQETASKERLQYGGDGIKTEFRRALPIIKIIQQSQLISFLLLKLMSICNQSQCHIIIINNIILRIDQDKSFGILRRWSTLVGKAYITVGALHKVSQKGDYFFLMFLLKNKSKGQGLKAPRCFPKGF